MGELRPGERLLLASGQEATVKAARVEAAARDGLGRPVQTAVYNFQVKGWHSYFAAPNEGATLGEFAWVHNADAYARFRTRTPAQVKDMRKDFSRSGGAREKFLKSEAEKPGAAGKYGKAGVERMREGKAPKGTVVHHKKPIVRGGSNRPSNFDVISEKTHNREYKRLHLYEEGENPYGKN